MNSVSRCPFDVLMAFQLLGSESAAAAIFEFAGDSYWGKTFARPLCEVIPIVPRGKYNGGATRLSFLHLPPEIRIDIYKLSFISHSTINFCQHYNHRPGLLCRCDETALNTPLRKFSSFKDVHPQFICTCRQIHAEAVSMLYGDNRFHLPCPNNLQRFCRNVGPVNAASLRNFEADYSTVVSRGGDNFW